MFNPLEARLSHVFYVNLLMARVAQASSAGLIIMSFITLPSDNIICLSEYYNYVPGINSPGASGSNVSRINYHYINLLVVRVLHV